MINDDPRLMRERLSVHPSRESPVLEHTATACSVTDEQLGLQGLNLLALDRLAPASMSTLGARVGCFA